MTLADRIDDLAATAKHHPEGLAGVDWRATLLAVGDHLRLLARMTTHARSVCIDHGEEATAVTVSFDLNGDDRWAFFELMGGE